MTRSPARAALAPWALGLASAMLATSCSRDPGQGAPASQAPASAQSPAAAFETVRTVLQNPRCANCHPPGDVPLQGDDSQPHAQNVQRGPEGRGVPGLGCSTCHGKANLPGSYGLHTPPGVSTEWHLPPPTMKLVFVGVGPRALCEQLKDPKSNGGLDMAALVKHVSSDPLVLWGWAPGPGRQPVPIAHATFVAAFETWAKQGGPCPAQ